jgi:hypothetical protein
MPGAPFAWTKAGLDDPARGDAEMLRLELGDLKELGFDLTLTGFDEVQLGSFPRGQDSARFCNPVHTGWRLTCTALRKAAGHLSGELFYAIKESATVIAHIFRTSAGLAKAMAGEE